MFDFVPEDKTYNEVVIDFAKEAGINNSFDPDNITWNARWYAKPPHGPERWMIKVEFQSLQDKKKLLTKVARDNIAKLPDDHYLKKVKCYEDLSFKARNKLKKLKAECRQKNSMLPPEEARVWIFIHRMGKIHKVRRKEATRPPEPEAEEESPE